LSNALIIYALICVGTDWLLKLGRTRQPIRDAVLWFVSLVFVAIKVWPQTVTVVLSPNAVEAQVITPQAQLAFVPIVICLIFALFYLFAPRLFNLRFSAALVRLQLALFVLGGLLFWSPPSFGRCPVATLIMLKWYRCGNVSSLREL
jgi:hypothetical protein